MKTVLILGAIESFCDLIMDIKKMGIKTVVCDYFPDAPGKKVADFAYDVSTIEVEELLEIAKKHKVDGVICAFSDRNLYSCYTIAKTLGLPTFYTKEIIDVLTDKIEMKKHLKKNNFPILNYAIIKKDFLDEELDDLTFPVIIKPIDNSGSKGVMVCDSVQEIREKFEECIEKGVNNKTDIIVEEYYRADEISLTGWVKKGKSYVTCIYDVGKNYGDNIVTSSIVFPSKYTKGGIEKISQLVQELTTSFGIEEGPITVQCFIGERGLKVSEYIYRLAGGSPYLFTKYLGGPNLAKMLTQLSIGENIDYQNLECFSSNVCKTFYQYRIYATKPGKIYYDYTEESIKQAIPECKYYNDYSSSGSIFSSVPTDGKIITRLICEIDNSKEKGYESFIDILEKEAVIYDDNNKNITTYNRPEKKVSTHCYDLKL